MMMFFKLFYSEKYLSSQAGLESITFRSPVRRSNHWAIRTQMTERRFYFDVVNIYVNIYVRASIHLLTLITTRIKTFTLSTLALSSENVLHRNTTYVHAAIWVLIAQWLERFTGDLKVVGMWVRVPLGNSDIFLSENRSKNYYYNNNIYNYN